MPWSRSPAVYTGGVVRRIELLGVCFFCRIVWVRERQLVQKH